MTLRYRLNLVSTARLLLAGSGLWGCIPTFANEDPPPNPVELEPVTVTGTRIPGTELESAAPLTVIKRADIDRMGASGLGEFLQELPMMSGSPTSSGRNFDMFGSPADGSVALDLRGLGASRTLVLVNSQRMPSQLNDLSVIPVVMVERVEVLKNGASSIYGADAVAGVVNVITRRDFEGATLNLQAGESFDLDGRTASGSFIWGRNFSRGNVVIGVERTEQKPIYASRYKEPWLRQDMTIIDSQEFRQYGFSGEPYTDLDGNGIEGWGYTGSSRIPYGRFDLRPWVPDAGFWTICQGAAGGGTLVTDYGPAGPRADCGPNIYNYAEYFYVQTPYQRSGVFLQSRLTLSDTLEASFEARYSNRKSRQNWAPLAYDTIGMLDPAIPADNTYNPFGFDIRRWSRRLIEGGDRLFTQDVDQWQIVAGLQGKGFSGWDWDLGYNFGRRERQDVRFGELDATRLPLALGPSFVDPSTGEVVCGTPQAPITGCVSLNAFSNPDSNPITPAMMDWLSLPLQESFETEGQVFNATLSRDWPGLVSGPVSTVLGYEYRRETYVRRPDAETIAKSTDEAWGRDVAGSYRVHSMFAELHLPLLSGAHSANLLELDLSARYDDYSSGGSVPTWQAALRWHPSTSLVLRATGGRVFREPDIYERFTRRSESIVLAVDPCSGIGGTPGGVAGSGECEGVPPGYEQFDNEVRVVEGGNEDLVVEEGDSFTAGLVWTPQFLSGLSVTLDWWRIDIGDAIGQPGASMILAGCYSGAVPAFCDHIHRFGSQSPARGELDKVETFVQNVGPELAEGIDWSVSHALNTNSGLWKLSWFGSWNFERRALVLRDANADSVAEAVSTNLAGRFEHRSLTRPSAYPEWRWRFVTDWSLNSWSASISIDYIGELSECGSPYADPFWAVVYCPDDPQVISVAAEDTFYGVSAAENTWENTVGPSWYLDVSLSYFIPRWGTQLTLGVTNLADKNLPFFQQGSFASTDGDTFRTFGRSWFARLRQDF